MTLLLQLLFFRVWRQLTGVVGVADVVGVLAAGVVVLAVAVVLFAFIVAAAEEQAVVVAPVVP